MFRSYSKIYYTRYPFSSFFEKSIQTDTQTDTHDIQAHTHDTQTNTHCTAACPKYTPRPVSNTHRVPKCTTRAEMKHSCCTQIVRHAFPRKVHVWGRSSDRGGWRGAYVRHPHKNLTFSLDAPTTHHPNPDVARNPGDKRSPIEVTSVHRTPRQIKYESWRRFQNQGAEPFRRHLTERILQSPPADNQTKPMSRRHSIPNQSKTVLHATDTRRATRDRHDPVPPVSPGPIYDIWAH